MMDGWMDGWMDDGWVDGWVDGWAGTVLTLFFSYPFKSQKKGEFCATKQTHLHRVSDGGATVAAGHTSGGTVGHWMHVGEGKMNQVAQRCLMISEGMNEWSKYSSCRCY